MAVLDPDVWRSASHRNMAAHLMAPLSAGARDTEVIVTGNRADVTRAAREPLVLAALRASTENVDYALETSLNQPGRPQRRAIARFAQYTERGSFLPLHRPDVDALNEMAAPFWLELTLTVQRPEGRPEAVPVDAIAATIELRLLEGVLGRVLYVLGAEKQRIRREARVVAFGRRLSVARDDALDRHGADLEVPRFDAQLEPRDGGVALVARHEPDAEYRRRLRLFRPWRLATRHRLLELLNGDAQDTAANAGPLGEMGVAERFSVHDEGNALFLAIHLVGSPDDAIRLRFLEHLRAVHLMWPVATNRADEVHARRFATASARDRTERLRAALRAGFRFEDAAAADPALAPSLAEALARLGDVLAVLDAQPHSLMTAQHANRGSRYELGLGADLSPFTAADLAELADRVLDPNRVPSGRPEADALLARLVPRPPSEDPIGHWLLAPCGLRTRHPTGDGRLFVSTLPIGGLVIGGATSGPPGAAVPLAARHHAIGDPELDLVLADGLAGALAGWTAAGGAAWSQLARQDAVDRLRAAPPQPEDAAALAVFRAAGLPAVREPARIIERLEALPRELVAVLLLAAGQSQAILSGDAGAADDLRRLGGLLRERWVASALPLVGSNSTVLLVVGVTRLPEAGTNLVRRRVNGVRWSVEGVAGEAGDVGRLGSRTTYTPTGPGLAAVVALNFERRERTDPYEYRVELGGGGRLSLLQYEYLMNLLEHMHPLGLAVDTAGIRDDQVDFTGSGAPAPLTAAQSRMFRPYRPRRGRIAGDIFGPDMPGLQLGIHATIGIDTLLKPPRDTT